MVQMKVKRQILNYSQRGREGGWEGGKRREGGRAGRGGKGEEEGKSEGRRVGGRRRKREGGMEEGGRGDSLRGRVGTSYYLVRV